MSDDIQRVCDLINAHAPTQRFRDMAYAALIKILNSRPPVPSGLESSSKHPAKHEQTKPVSNEGRLK